MADFNVEVVLESAQLQALFARLVDTGENLAPLMADIAEGLLQRTEDRFDAQVAPDGSRWAPLSPRYAARKRRKGYDTPLLVREGRLRGELRSGWGGDYAEVATAPLAYAALHQFGGTPDMPAGAAAVPARPYLGVSDEDLAWIEEVAGEYLEAIAGRG